MILCRADERAFLCWPSTRKQETQNIRRIQNSTVVENLMVTAVRLCAQLIIETGSLNVCVREMESIVSTLFLSSLFFFLLLHLCSWASSESLPTHSIGPSVSLRISC